MSDRTTRPADENGQAGETGVHPIVIKIAIGAVLWFLAVVWIAFAGSGGVDLDLTIVTLFFAIFFALFLLLASFSLSDPRWPTKQTRAVSFESESGGIPKACEC